MISQPFSQNGAESHQGFEYLLSLCARPERQVILSAPDNHVRQLLKRRKKVWLIG